MKRETSKKTAPRTVRCAIYTRKSTEEGLDQDFNSLDAQRESGEAYVASQQHEGWVCLPARYDDGGYTGGNMERPAVRRLMADIEAGLVDCVVVYKVDRLSRSLLDFARMMETFERHQVAFVSVTQQFNTSSSMGRLILNVLLSFAQFEREMISERTRDKMAAARRKGKWLGGTPVLGYDLEPKTRRLVINKEEAQQVRGIFELYLEIRSLLALADEVNRRGWTTKRTTTKAGRSRGGRPFDKANLHSLLTHVGYRGKVTYRGEVHEGEQPAIIDAGLWQKVQAQMSHNGRTGGTQVRNRFGAILKGLIFCRACGCAMSPSHSTRGNKRYRYYVCLQAQKRGWQHCPAPSVPAGEIERIVVGQIQAIGRNPALIAATLAECDRQTAEQRDAFDAELARCRRERDQVHRELRKLVSRSEIGNPEPLAPRMSEVQERLRAIEERTEEMVSQRANFEASAITPEAVREALSEFTAIWESLTHREQGDFLGQLIEQVTYDGVRGKIALTLKPAGLRALGQEVCA